MVIIYFGYMGLVEIAHIRIGTDAMEGRLNSIQNLNIINDMNVLAIFMIYWIGYMGYNYKLFKYNIPKIFYLLFFSFPIFLVASRGSAILLIMGFIF